jgi:uncharacterized protein (TIGR00297 family)
MIPAAEFLNTAWVQTSPLRLIVALGVTIAFAVLARAVRGVSASGAVAGGAICFLLFSTAGPAAFASLASVFVLAWLTTRFGYSRKIRLGTAERREGRTASQVAANLGVSTACALLATWYGKTALLVACSAALAEAAADTVSSEFGQAYSESARLVTTGRRVPAGTNGGVTVPGTLAGVVAALVVSAVSSFGGLIPKAALWFAALAGIVGMIADSYLGAWFELRGKLNNNAVNFLSTLLAAVLAWVCWSLTTGH